MSVDEKKHVEEKKAIAVAALRAAHKHLGEARDGVVQSVVDARHVKAPWQRIADELEIAQPNAIRKFKPSLNEREPKQRWENEADPVTPALLAVRRAHRALADAERAEVREVAGARSAGVTWGAIAEAVGMKEPNAVVKYKPMLEEKRIFTVREDAGPV
ncbi:hypothetical protein ABT352_22685 [Streptosporangium sp. NPDC000563]|uniref:hypothetical protein n=1 Tax=Streptosporangium sp. NPDC000563 TaxID=3154366 RepID=UPI00332B0618